MKIVILAGMTFLENDTFLGSLSQRRCMAVNKHLSNSIRRWISKGADVCEVRA